MDLRACPAGECRSFIRTDIYIRICTHMRIKITFKLAILLRGLLFTLMFQSILTALRSSSCSPLFFFSLSIYVLVDSHGLAFLDL